MIVANMYNMVMRRKAGLDVNIHEILVLAEKSWAYTWYIYATIEILTSLPQKFYPFTIAFLETCSFIKHCHVIQ